MITSRPLSGIKVVEFAVAMAAPSAGMFLGDLGADVVKVERVHGGDQVRQSFPLLFECVNRNKRSIALDIDTSDGAAIAQALAVSADVVIQGFRPGALEAKGLGAKQIREMNPRLVYASLSGFGQDGPGRGRRGIDAVVQAESGMAFVMDQVNHRLGFVDAATGIALAQGILAALFQRERTGLGDELQISLLDTALWLQMLPIAEYGVERSEPLNPGRYREIHHPAAGMFDVADGRIYFTVNQQKDWAPLCEMLEALHLVSDERFSTLVARQENYAALAEILHELFIRFDRRTILARAKERGILMAPILTYQEMFGHPQVAINGIFREVTSANGVDVVQVRAPYQLIESTSTMTRAPTVGEHSKAVLAEIGYDEARIAGLVTRGVVGL